MSARRDAIAGLATASAFAACSLVFPADDLSRGGAGGAGMGGAAATTTSASSASSGGGGGGGGGHDGGMGGGLPPPDGGPCTSNAQCDDGDPCTADVCGAAGCKSTLTPGVACAPGNDCNPPSKCSAVGTCVPGQPDPSKCDDQNTCTLDACGAAGCTHSPNTGAPCNDGNSCDAAGTCNATGKCAAAPVAVQSICLNMVGNCPGGYYVSSIYCDAFCGSCSPFCVNAAKCSFACGTSFTACCGGAGCSAATCPAPYHVASAPMKVAQCACVPADGVTCSL